MVTTTARIKHEISTEQELDKYLSIRRFSLINSMVASPELKCNNLGLAEFEKDATGFLNFGFENSCR